MKNVHDGGLSAFVVSRLLLLLLCARSCSASNLALVNFESEASPLQGQLWGWKAVGPGTSEGWVGGSDY